ncbi:DUF3298 domain-containing protein [Cryomorphaceae bacterium]|nr:DUF3298 domain-containing protein [Cryomorphaceae bacterium]
MRITLFILALTGGWLLASCQMNEPKSAASEEVSTQALGYQMIDTIREFIVEEGSEGYVRIELAFPSFYGPDYAEDLNRLVASKLWAQNRTTGRSWQEQMSFFIDQYKELQSEVEYVQPWTHKESLSIRRLDEHVLTLEREYSEYSGGAHGRHETHYYNFDVATGDTLLLDDLIKPGAREAVEALVDFHYREQQGIDAEASLIDEAGLNVASIPLTENFALDEKGIRFFYNPYEIAAYAAGAIMVDVPMTDLANYLLD